MTLDSSIKVFRRLVRVSFVLAFVVGTPGHGDSVIMKNGIVYRSQGAPDRDNTLLYISDDEASWYATRRSSGSRRTMHSSSARNFNWCSQ